ncbi:hypothetical protein HS088_TW03G01059 [Tripterygium wilfordii]|uniref:Uncharacterized protein n=1 Tax=Tripterygium wilfordii TaxID=458696 RepID=A0A7J7DWG5_TRIWF|nr:hypothetical protein HS088_TW03G01059 [Tripterygium wilfordii]
MYQENGNGLWIYCTRRRRECSRCKGNEAVKSSRHPQMVKTRACRSKAPSVSQEDDDEVQSESGDESSDSDDSVMNVRFDDSEDDDLDDDMFLRHQGLLRPQTPKSLPTNE